MQENSFMRQFANEKMIRKRGFDQQGFLYIEGKESILCTAFSFFD